MRDDRVVKRLAKRGKVDVSVVWQTSYDTFVHANQLFLGQRNCGLVFVNVLIELDGFLVKFEFNLLDPLALLGCKGHACTAKVSHRVV